MWEWRLQEQLPTYLHRATALVKIIQVLELIKKPTISFTFLKYASKHTQWENDNLIYWKKEKICWYCNANTFLITIISLFSLTYASKNAKVILKTQQVLWFVFLKWMHATARIPRKTWHYQVLQLSFFSFLMDGWSR